MALLSGQPTELLQRIAGYLSPEDRLFLSRADPRNIAPAIRDETRIGTFLKQVDCIDTREQFMALLILDPASLHAVGSLPSAFHGEAVAALATRLRHQGAWLFRKGDGAVDLMSLRTPLLCTIQALPLEQQGTPLTALARDFAYVLPSDEHLAYFNAVLKSVQALPPEQRDAPLAALARNFADALPGDKYLAYFDVLLKSVQALPPEQRGATLAALARHLGRNRLLHNEYVAQFAVLLQSVQPLPTCQRGELLAALCDQFTLLYSQVPQDVLVAYFTALLDGTTKSPPEQQGELLGTLGDSIVIFDPAERGERFAALLNAIGKLPPERQGAMLTKIVKYQQLRLLPDAGHVVHFEALLNTIRALPPGQQGEPLLALVGELEILSNDGHLQLFKHFSKALGVLPPGQAGCLLLTLARRLFSLTRAERVEHLTPLFNALNELSPERRGVLLESVISSTAQWPFEFSAHLLDVAETLPPAQRRALLALLSQELRKISAGQCLEHFTHLQDALRRLPNDQQGPLFESLVHALALHRDAEVRRELLTRLLDTLAMLPPGRGVLVSAYWDYQHLANMDLKALPVRQQNTLLTILVRQLKHFPEATRRKAFKDLLEALKTLPPDQQSGPLAALAYELDLLPEAKRFASFKRLLAAVMALPPDQQGKPLTALADMTDWLQGAECIASFNRLVSACAPLPPDERAALLTALAGQLRRFPGDTFGTAFTGLLTGIRQLPREHRRGLRSTLLNNIEVPATFASLGKVIVWLRIWFATR
ncbi:hypothetical protein [Burkholderia sp. Bp8986]|uniref:hypothetical protein n=1 Tax=Burkholderia sp. Bp8986 TaxID=2184550 RepID=UPI000F598150|nr:hypothetical protein [Burkholderia sp. Bp8986]